VTGVLVRDVAWGIGRADVRCSAGRIAEVGTDLSPRRGEEVVIEAVAVLPGLHDHHLHLMAMAAHRGSVDLGPERVASPGDLARVVTDAAAERTTGPWIRAVGYDESTAGELDRWALDRMAPDRPVRVQHRSGHLWVLNSLACELVGLDGDVPPGVERIGGVATGRMVDADDWLAGRLPPVGPPDLAAVGRRLAALGVTGVTDCTPVRSMADLEVLAAAVGSGSVPQRVMVTGGIELAGADAPDGVALGPVKVMVGDLIYPSVDALAATIDEAHVHGRAVAVHCASRIAAVLAIAAWEQAGSRSGDRMEHGSVLPPDLVVRLGGLGITVVTQPGFLYDRGDRYLADVEPEDVPHLYRCATLEAAGVGVGGSTDAPFGPDDPWLAMRSAVRRRTRTGSWIGPDEGVDRARALGLFLSDPAAPGGSPRTVVEGGPADLVLLDCTVTQALEDLDARHVVGTVARGEVVHRA
jgi:predicted amidohydrolase YtcJ